MNFSKIFQNSYVLPHAAAFVLPFLTDEKKNISQCFPCIRVVQEPADLVTFSEEILNGKLHFLYIGRIDILVRLRV